MYKWWLFLCVVASAEYFIAVSGTDRSHSEPPVVCAGCVPVFYYGYNGSACYRIPSIIETSKGTLLAFAENRISDCSDNGKVHEIVARRSHDFGLTWGDMIKVAVDENPPCPGCPSAISNPNPVEVHFPNNTKAILLHYDTMNNPGEKAHGKDMQKWSFDDGVTWTRGSVLEYPPAKNVGGLIGPSIGIQAQNGSIYFPALDFLNNHFIYYSDDYGKTWSSSNSFGNGLGLSECSIAFIPGMHDNIMMNCRTSSHRRAQFIWTNRTLPSKAMYPAGLVDPNCQGSLVTHKSSVYLSNANSTTSRARMVVRKTSDGGKSWSDGVVVSAGPSAYSQLVSMQKGTKLGLLFEAGRVSSSETISFVAVPDEEEENEYDEVLLASGASMSGFAGSENWITWPDSGSSKGIPFEKSKVLTEFQYLEGKNAQYGGADTWYPAWASDGNLYTPWTDGRVQNVSSGSGGTAAAGWNSTTGYATVIGDDPFNLTLKNVKTFTSSTYPYQGRYPCGSLAVNGIWFYGTYYLNNPNQSGVGPNPGPK